MERSKPTNITHVVFDVDGVFNTGQFLYTTDGKFAKIFGPHDSDGIKMLKPLVKISTISADKRGWSITKKRIADDMGLDLYYVSEEDRQKWFIDNCDLESTVYMGDGIYDAEIFKMVAYSIAPQNAFYTTKECANYITRVNSGEGAVLDACLHIIDKFFY